LVGLTAGAGLALALAGVGIAAGWAFFWLPLASGIYCGLSAGSFAYTTRRGKFVVWAGELDRLGLTGNEQLLDMGCGRGAVLILAAKRLPAGKVTGIDLWRSVDQSGNAEESARTNVALEGFAERVELVTGDMRALPFEDGGFDVVVSSLAVHNIIGADGRARAVLEAFRMLKPGGRLLLADLRNTEAYAATLRAAGATDVTVRGLGWRFGMADHSSRRAWSGRSSLEILRTSFEAVVPWATGGRSLERWLDGPACTERALIVDSIPATTRSPDRAASCQGC
jgi:ubiquinone/menaquinone biosynthesis C-methylase UbiE